MFEKINKKNINFYQKVVEIAILVNTLHCTKIMAYFMYTNIIFANYEERNTFTLFAYSTSKKFCIIKSVEMKSSKTAFERWIERQVYREIDKQKNRLKGNYIDM